MNLEQFAKKAGVILIECGPQWGGRIGYKTKDNPNLDVCGFRTELAAYKDWLTSTFGDRVGKTVMKLIMDSNKKEVIICFK